MVIKDEKINKYCEEILKTLPLLFISSLSGNKVNLSVYASYMLLRFGARIVLESEWYKTEVNEQLKDTLVNSRKEGWLMLNVPTEVDFSKYIYEIAQPLPYDKSEAEEYGIDIEYVEFKGLKYPKIAKAPVALLCKMEQEIFPDDIKNNSLLLLKPICIWVDDNLPKDSVEIKLALSKLAIYHFGSYPGGGHSIGRLAMFNLEQEVKKG